MGYSAPMRTASPGRRKGGGQGPTFGDLMERAGQRAEDTASRSRLSINTVLRAKRGKVPKPLGLSALANALGVSEGDCRSAIERSGS